MGGGGGGRSESLGIIPKKTVFLLLPLTVAMKEGSNFKK